MNKKYIILGANIIEIGIAKEMKHVYIDTKGNKYSKTEHTYHDTIDDAKKSMINTIKNDLMYYEDKMARLKEILAKLENFKLEEKRLWYLKIMDYY